MNEEKRARILSWGISLLVHALVLAAAASAGLFLLVQSPAEPDVKLQIWSLSSFTPHLFIPKVKKLT